MIALQWTQCDRDSEKQRLRQDASGGDERTSRSAASGRRGENAAKCAFFGSRAGRVVGDGRVGAACSVADPIVHPWQMS